MGENENHFKKGKEVDVCFDEEGFRGSWYSATVLRPPNTKKKIHLEFRTLVSMGNPSKNHCQYVDVLLVRPLPPREPTRSFEVGEEVDAFHNDGWWEGFIINILPPLQPSGPTRYSVFFRGSREQLDFSEPDIRLHREWVYGRWVPPLQTPTSSSLNFKLHFHSDSFGEMDEWLCQVDSELTENGDDYDAHFDGVEGREFCYYAYAIPEAEILQYVRRNFKVYEGLMGRNGDVNPNNMNVDQAAAAVRDDIGEVDNGGGGGLGGPDWKYILLIVIMFFFFGLCRLLNKQDPITFYLLAAICIFTGIFTLMGW